MTALAELREKLIHKMGDAAKVASLADHYLMEMEKRGSDFRLPREHAVVKPILEEFAGDFDGFAAWLHGIHRDMPFRSAVRQEFYIAIRRVDVRLNQDRNRELTRLATKVAVDKKWLPDVFSLKQAYAAKLRKYWELRRTTFLASHRAASPTKRLTADERTELSAEFWETIRKEIENGESIKP